jgi:TPP-dependent pyruvate/acetoin dehydrogenase alpha subunit
MQKLKTILVASVVAASLFAAAGTAWAQTESGQRGTSWTAADGATVSDGPAGASWELLEF